MNRRGVNIDHVLFKNVGLNNCYYNSSEAMGQLYQFNHDVVCDEQYGNITHF